MGFFQLIEALNIGGNVTIIITKNSDNTFTTTTAIQHLDIKAEHFRPVIPLNITGTAAMLDKDFFTAFGQWMVKEDKALVSNVQEVEESYKKAQEKAKDKAKQYGNRPSGNNTNGTSQAVQKEVKLPAIDPEYKKAMDQATMLIEQKKYGQAKTALPDKQKYPAHAAEIDALAAKIYENRSDLLL